MPLALTAAVCLPANVLAQGVEYVKANYTKYEYRIPMRDGKRLFTAVYCPKDQSQRYPIMLYRTPYNVRPYGADQYPADLGPSAFFGTSGYIFAYQDVRGRWMSEGEFVDARPYKPVKSGPQDFDESTDAWDTVEWLIQHVANHNGRVGMAGVSYPGFYTDMAAIDAHPAIKAVSPQAPIGDWFIGDDWHHNGVLMLPHVFNFMAGFGHPRPQPTKKPPLPFDHETPDGYQFFLNLGPLSNVNAKYYKGDVPFWNEVVRHPNYDQFWKDMDVRPHLKNVRPAVMTVGGWFDAEDLFGALQTYQSIEKQSPGADNTLVMGPWAHSDWHRIDGQSFGPVPFNSKTAEFFREKIELPFFEYHLKGKGELKQPEAWMFETGTNQWREFDAWPPRQGRPKSLYFREGGRLAADPPGEARGEAAYDEYVSDPAKPVPFIDKIGIGMTREYMLEDQRFAARRPDVLVYQTDPLEEDLRIAGPITAELQVSTSGTDSDWVVKVIDVYPDDYPDPNPNPMGVRMGGYQQLVRGEPMRGKFRNSFEKPEPFVPNQPAAVKFTLPDVCHTFRTGHRLMVQVQSSWFPLADRNPQTFVDIYAAKESDFRKATQRVYHTRELASRVNVLVMP
jgi:uncharacterized protein